MGGYISSACKRVDIQKTVLPKLARKRPEPMEHPDHPVKVLVHSHSIIGRAHVSITSRYRVGCKSNAALMMIVGGHQPTLTLVGPWSYLSIRGSQQLRLVLKGLRYLRVFDSSYQFSNLAAPLNSQVFQLRMDQYPLQKLLSYRPCATARVAS